MVGTQEERLTRILRGQDVIMQEVHSILDEAQKKDDILEAVILSTLKHQENDIRGLDRARIFHEEEIRRACVKYRLRFLPAGRFKGPLPGSALHAVHQLEARAGQAVRGFKVMAPAKRFKLCDCDADPLLFIPVGGGSYYLVHKWGNELSAWRAITGWPLRGWRQMAITIAVVAAVLAALVPTMWLTQDAAAGWWGGHRLWAFSSLLLCFAAATSYGWLAFFGQFSEEAWNSKTFN